MDPLVLLRLSPIFNNEGLILKDLPAIVQAIIFEMPAFVELKWW